MHPFREDLISQIPALQLLMVLGYTYLTPEEALAQRGGKLGRVVLEGVLLDWLRAHNAITYQGQTHAFSDANLQAAVRALTDEPNDGLLQTNARLYERLTLGISLPQTIGGDTRSFDLNYIDWLHPENNVYHVTDEFSVQRARSDDTRRPDIVVFVNGLPLVVIECKRPDLEKPGAEKAVMEAVSQMIRNQRDDEIPQLFVFSQLLMGLSVNDVLYATTHTASKFWSVWREGGDIEAAVKAHINRPLSVEQKRTLYAHRGEAEAIWHHFEKIQQAGDRLPTVQDRALYSLLRPTRLLELIYQFIVFDGGEKKIARYQQYFAVQETLTRVAHLGPGGARGGGVIWHTTGSGKSLTMVMLAKALTLHPNLQRRNPRVILVTDRINLDKQIGNTFRACGKEPVRALSGKQLIELIQDGKTEVITTVIDKFEAAERENITDASPDIFVLVDEGQRTQYGSIHAKMRRVFTHACYIGFTGTPLLKKDKSTLQKFGGLIHPYSMRQAVADGAVVPLKYEGRLAETAVNQAAIDQWFERVTQYLSADQKLDLKRKFSRAEEVNRADQRLQQIAYDLSRHFVENLQGTGRKGQLAASSKDVALKYKKFLDEFGEITSEVIISAPDTREGNTDVDESTLPEIAAFWKKMMTRFGNEEKYNDELIEQFGREDGFELLIVVDKLLVGFDEPRNSVLYIDKSLKEHAVLQAIARVNRIFEGKDYGWVVDYYGVLGELNTALHTYDALEGFDAEDVAEALTEVAAEVAQLPQRHSDLWAVFAPVANKKDTEALERFLGPEDVRGQFYEALTAYTRCLQLALGTVVFYREVPKDRAQRYKDDLRFFHNLRASVRQRYAETIDYKDYEQKIRKLMDAHIQSSGVKPLTELVNIFDRERFAQEVDRVEGTAAKADTIAHRVKRTLTERMEQDPAFYKKFSKLIDETIQAYKEGRLGELQYLEQVTEINATIVAGRDDALPAELRRHKHAAAYYGVIREPMANYFTASDLPRLTLIAQEMAVRVETIIEHHKIRDWVNNHDVHKRMKAAIEDYLFDELAPQHHIRLNAPDLDEILDRLIEVARQRDAL